MVTKLIVYLEHPDAPTSSARVLRILNDVQYPGPSSKSYSDVASILPSSGTWSDADENLLNAVIKTVAAVEQVTEVPMTTIEGV